MADRLRIVRLVHGKRPIVEYDMYAPDVSGIVSLRDSFKPRSASSPQTTLAASGRPRRPGRYVNRTDQPAQMVGTWLVIGDADTSPARVEQALAAIDTGRFGRFFEWKPELNEFPVYIPILGPGGFTANYRWVEHSQAGAIPIEVSWPISGVVRGLEWDVDETFTPGTVMRGGTTNLVPNPAFTTDLTAWDSTSTFYINSATITRDTTEYWNWVSSLKVVTTASPGQQGARCTITGPFKAGRTYTFSAYVKASTGTPSVTGFFGAGATETGVANAHTISTSWTRISETWTLAANQNTVFCGVRSPNAGAAITFYIDGVQVEEGSLTGYIDGDMAAGRWNSTPQNGSSSQLYDSDLGEFTFVTDAATTVARGERELIWLTSGESILLHTGRNTGPTCDTEIQLEITTPPSLTNRELKLRISQIDANNYIAFVLDATGLRIDAVVAGTPTTIDSSTYKALPNQRYYIGFRREGNRLNWYFDDINNIFAWSNSLYDSVDTSIIPIQPYGMVIPAAIHTALPEGYDGISVKGTGVTPGFILRRYERLPYTYRLPAHNARFQVATPGVPDGPPCLADLTVWNSLNTVHDWAAIMWGARNGIIRRFGMGTSNNSYDSYDALDHSLAGTGRDGQSGTSTVDIVQWSGGRKNATAIQVGTPATTNAGMGYRHPGVFNAGDVLTAEAWIRLANFYEKTLTLQPALYWRLGSTAGLTDQSGHGRDGTAAGGVTIGGVTGALAGDTDTATDLDGVDDRITSTYNPFGAATTLSVSGYAWRDTNTSIDTLFGSTGTGAGTWVRLAILAGGSDMAFTIDGGTTSVTWTGAWPGTAQWVYWALYFNETSNEVRFTTNNSISGAMTLTTAYDAAPGNFVVGAHSGSVDPFDGRIDEVAVWSPNGPAPATLNDQYKSGVGKPNVMQWAATPSSGEGGTVTGTNVTLSTLWQRVSLTYTAQKYETDVDLVLRQTTAVANTFYVDGPLFYEGPLQPADTAIDGGVPPFGFLFMEDSAQPDSASLTGRPAVLQHPLVATVGSVHVDWIVNPRTLVPPELSEQLLIEVYAVINDVPASVVNLRGVVQTRPYMYAEDLYPAVQWQYGQPYGSSGRVITATGQKVTKLGTISYDASSNRPHPWDLRVTFNYDAGGTAGQLLKVAGLLLIPAQSRAVLPTGKRPHNTIGAPLGYPSFMPEAIGRVVRIIRSDLSGEYVDFATRSNSSAPGFGGQLIELPAGGMVDMSLVTTAGVPDDPSGDSSGYSGDFAFDVHIGIVPRYNLMAIPR